MTEKKHLYLIFDWLKRQTEIIPVSDLDTLFYCLRHAATF